MIETGRPQGRPFSLRRENHYNPISNAFNAFTRLKRSVRRLLNCFAFQMMAQKRNDGHCQKNDRQHRKSSG